jgi:cyclophilin family peptidyl-prolyl cis-trans isomerase
MANYDLTPDSEGLSKAVATMTLEKGGVMKFRFFPNEAPNTVKRITQLISEGFYDGIIFHRVVPGFVVQAGDPTGTGTSGSGVKQKAEFNKHKHVEGILSMARTSDPNSADSQFFIMLGTHPHLDGQYTVFGKTIEGVDLVKTIKQGDKIKSWTIE